MSYRLLLVSQLAHLLLLPMALIPEEKNHIFFENVKGLLRSGFREYFEYIILQLKFPTVVNTYGDWRIHSQQIENLSKQVPSYESYDVSVNLVNAADYGVPQKRERVLIIGIRRDLEKSWKLPSPTHSSDAPPGTP